jgi:hypothetical protein
MYMNEYIASSLKNQRSSSGEFTILLDRDAAERFLVAEAADEACPCPVCRGQDVARERGRSPP